MTRTTLFNAKWANGGFASVRANGFHRRSAPSHLRFQGGNVPVPRSWDVTANAQHSYPFCDMAAFSRIT